MNRTSSVQIFAILENFPQKTIKAKHSQSIRPLFWLNSNINFEWKKHKIPHK